MVNGAEVAKFLKELFARRHETHEVTLTSTRSFNNLSFSGYTSTFYPVFVNLIDNAIYWLRDRNSTRTIRLNAEGDKMLVTDTGPGIATRDRLAIFESGFSRKPGGRGLGLSISRDALRREGYDLKLDEPNPLYGARFLIVPILEGVE